MRFGAPRSLSPSPVRGQMRRSTYGLKFDDSDDDSNSNNEPEDSDSSSSSEAEDSSDLEYRPLPSIRPTRSYGSPEEQRQTEETIASIRLRTRHHDPYEEWEKQLRKEAFLTARKNQSQTVTEQHLAQEKLRQEEAQRLAAEHAKEMAEVQARLESFRLQQQNDEKKLREAYDQRQKQLWNRIEYVIKAEEDKVAKRLAEEQKKREEEERKRKEEELKKRLAEEKKKVEEEQKRKEEEEKKKAEEEKKKKEEEEEKQLAEEAQRKRERLEAEKHVRQQFGMTTAEDDWNVTRRILKHLKAQTIAVVKADKAMRTEWGNWRRQITPKIGQLVDDQDTINTVSQQIHDILRPPSGSHHPLLYTALLSSLSKTILLQAEVEVTAEKRSAGPLSQVTFNLLTTLVDFPEVFFAKLVQRVGGWPIPIVVPSEDIDQRKWADDDEKRKVMGFRHSETEAGLESRAEYMARVAGIMRVYFGILKIRPTIGPLKPMFRFPRYWTWFARLVGERSLLETEVAAELMYTALEVMGDDALQVWGQQWVKMLGLIYEGATKGLGNGKFLGGETPEGKAARCRTVLQIERILFGGPA